MVVRCVLGSVRPSGESAGERRNPGGVGGDASPRAATARGHTGRREAFSVSTVRCRVRAATQAKWPL
jgi:hypothetical protein